jgi:hypothetical protein
VRTLAHQSDVDDLLRRLQTVGPDSAARWGRMSAHQMICHLSDAMRVAAGQKTASAASGLAQRTIVKWIAIYLPVRWPPGIPTRPEIDQLAGGTKPQNFAKDVEDVATRLRNFVEQPPANRPPHPIFGPLSRKAWLRWAYLHTDHHLRQFGA